MDYFGWIFTLGGLAVILLVRCIYLYVALLDVGMDPKRVPVQPLGVVATRNWIFPNRFIFPSFVVLLGLSVLCYLSPNDASVALIVVGFAAVLVGIRLHAKSEVLVRKDVGIALSGGGSVLAMATFSTALGSSGFVPALELACAVAFLAVGVAACCCLAVGLPSVRSVLFLLLLTVFTLVQSAHRDSGIFAVQLDRQMAVDFVEEEGGALGPERYIARGDWARVLRALACDGGRAPDVSVAKRAHINHLVHSGATGAGDEVLTRSLESYGYFQGRDYEKLNALELAWSLEERRGRPREFFMYTAIKGLQSRDLSPDARLLLADDLAEVQLVPGFSPVFSFIVPRLRVLEQLGYPEKGESYKHAARGWLVSRVPEGLEETSDAVYLMARFGVPEGIDLVELHDTLEAQALAPLFGSAELDAVLAHVTLASIEQLPEWEPIAETRSGLLYLLWRHRIALTALLIATASVLITLRTPKAAISEPTA